MNIFKWFIGRSSVRSAAMSLYKRGLARVERGDPKGALDAFTSAIGMPDAPDDVKAMALYNRALLLTGMGDTANALADLNAVMTMPAALRSIKLAAKRRLDRMQRHKESAATANPNYRAEN
jgi:hypothetical protein